MTSLVNEAYGREQRQNSQIRSWKLFAAQMLDAVTARRVTRFHAVSENVAVVMTRRLRLDRARVDVIARGRDAAQLGTRTVARREAARHALGARGETEIVLAVGRHEFQKGFDIVLEAVAKLRVNRPELRLLIAGREGNTTAALRELVDRLAIGDIVTFLGFRDDVPDLLCAADVFVSASRWEGSPGGIIEAMALEVPIVATDIAAVQEVFGSEDLALLVPPDDADALAAALGRSINEPGSRARVAAARARFLERFTIDAVADRMVAFYERALANRRG